jgi:hypothetical protein
MTSFDYLLVDFFSRKAKDWSTETDAIEHLKNMTAEDLSGEFKNDSTFEIIQNSLKGLVDFKFNDVNVDEILDVLMNKKKYQKYKLELQSLINKLSESLEIASNLNSKNELVVKMAASIALAVLFYYALERKRPITAKF